MNVIKILPVTDIATECHNPMLSEYRKVCLKGKVINIKVPCNIVLFVTDKCPYNCSWCINRENKVNEYKNEIDQEQYLLAVFDLLAELEKANKAINNDNFEITITGGEPTIDLIRFTSILQSIHMYKIPIRTVSTTGHYLFETVNNVPLYQHMISHGAVNNVNISRHAIDPKENSEIFGVKKEPLSIEQIEMLSDVFRLNGGELRVSANINAHEKYGIHTWKDIKRFMHSIKARSFIFRDLVNSDSKYFDDIYESIKVCSKCVDEVSNSSITIESFYNYTIDHTPSLIKVYHPNRMIDCPNLYNTLFDTIRVTDCINDENPVYDLLVFRNGKLYTGFNPNKSKLLIDFTNDEIRR